VRRQKRAETEGQRREMKIQRDGETETEETERNRYGKSRDRGVQRQIDVQRCSGRGSRDSEKQR
jgi:hypothetical protein